jgi:Winged helix-turn-helix DNA-binding
VSAVLDNFKQAQQDILARMRELEPMVQEYEELKRIAEQLQLDAAAAPSPARASAPRRTRRAARARTAPARRARSTPASRARSAPAASAEAAPAASAEAAPATPSPSRGGRRRATRSRRSGAGNRREDILRLVGEKPGVTINQLGKDLGVDPTGLYRPVRALVAEGKIDKQGPALHPKAA